MMGIRWTEIIVVGVAVLGIALAVYLRRPSDLSEGTSGNKKVEPIVEIQPTFTVNVDETSPLQIGIIGESDGGEKSRAAFTHEALQELLQVLKNQHVQAVFSTGNLATGLELSDVELPKHPSVKLEPTSLTFKKQLDELSQKLVSVLGEHIPFFPALGDWELNVPGGAAIVAKHFHLAKAIFFDSESFAYTVSLGNAFFVVVTSVSAHPRQDNAGQHFSQALLEWLEAVLAAVPKKGVYRFVVGHKPAFAVEGAFADQHDTDRDEFWEILRRHGVLAYFASHEHLFNRTNHKGVWQIISGGYTISEDEGKSESIFYQCLVMNIPVKAGGAPKIQVYDVDGKVIDTFDLTTSQGLLHERNIY